MVRSHRQRGLSNNHIAVYDDRHLRRAPSDSHMKRLQTARTTATPDPQARVASQ
ncbi:hypothetical protein HMPREF1979_01330 [Actinomyces johnsonii F0542]|uniref:Uncharacterized protein n=1 Tax=Actinomyces johnsonii F0542 TaxID=1321818 RepID=U1S157_9ACTO|nr:hypothetical protein HMPREF1979_01330 [Actinomyces johnsonii F0542]